MSCLLMSDAPSLKDSIERKLNIYTHIERYGIDLTPHYMYQDAVSRVGSDGGTGDMFRG